MVIDENAYKLGRNACLMVGFLVLGGLKNWAVKWVKWLEIKAFDDMWYDMRLNDGKVGFWLIFKGF